MHVRIRQATSAAIQVKAFERVWSFLAALLLLGLASCVPYRMYRGASVLEHAGYTLSFVELDDQGELWSPDQLDSVLQHIERANRTNVGIVLALYVHGWNHDASPREDSPSGNLQGFETLLRRIAEAEARSPAGSAREVVGIYVGWRGRRIRGPLNLISFFDRKGAATRIADAVATEVIYRVMTTAKSNPQSKCVLLGHSFGGLVLERTLGQALVAFLAAGDGSQQAEFPADLVVLLNPASQAIDAKQLIDVFDRNRLRLYRIDSQGHRIERPLVVSVTSVGDWATRLLYPGGLWVKSITKKFRQYTSDYCATSTSQRKYYTRTPGHHPDLISHVIEAQEVAGDTVEPARREIDPVTGDENIVFGGQGIRFTIRRKARAFNETPYWIMQAPRSLVPNHSKIFGFNVFRLLGSLLFATGALEPSSTTEIERSEGIRPLGIVPFESGALFLERSRRLYRLRENEAPRFHSCLPALLDPDDDLGLSVTEGFGYSAILHQRRPDRFRTEVIRFHLGDDSIAIEERRMLKSDERFSTVTFDVPGRRGFWIPEGKPEVWSADLGRKHPVPRFLARLDSATSIWQVLFSGAGLFVTDDQGGLYRIDPNDPEAMAESLGSLPAVPADMTFDPPRHRLLLLLPSPPALWALECNGASCSPARELARLDGLQRPVAMARAPDGDLWLADPAAGLVARVSPSGSVEQVYDHLASTLEE